MNAAKTAGPASSPLPLFYALSQGGRAIVAALGESPEVFGHGLGEKPIESLAPDPLKLRIERRARKGGVDAFGAVAKAVGSEVFGEDVELGAVWAALPSVHMLPTDHHDPEWPIALDVFENSSTPEEGTTKVQLISFSGAPGGEDERTIRQTLGKYPSLPKGTRFGVNWVPLRKNAGRNWIANVA